MTQERKQLFLIKTLQILIYTYLVLRVFFWYTTQLSLSDNVLNIFFFIVELFILTHALAFLSYLKTVALHKIETRKTPPIEPSLNTYPVTAFVVASYKEPLDVLESTLLCLRNLTYPAKHLYLLDDTRYDQPWSDENAKIKYKCAIEELCAWLEINLFRRQWHHAKAGIINDFLLFRAGDKNPLFHMTINQEDMSDEPEKYLAVFDADMNPLPQFAEPLIARLEKEPRVAYVQTPQYYTNFLSNRVARAASVMQVIFYEYICEAKGIKKVIPLCGTNVILRIEALDDVGGFDCSSVTEDFATAFNMNGKGWTSLYLNNVTAFGMGPEDLGSFFKQQFRWALGTSGLLTKVVKTFIFHPFKFPAGMLKEYALSSSYYYIGWIYLILMLGPALYLFLDVSIYAFPPGAYFLIIIPYNIIINYLFYWSHVIIGYPAKDLFKGVILGILSMPIYMKASIAGLFGFKGHFVVTPKGECNMLPLRDLWCQLFFGMLTFATIVYGCLRLVYEGEPVVGIAVNMIWALYYFCIFSSIFYFNNSAESTGPVEAKGLLNHAN